MRSAVDANVLAEQLCVIYRQAVPASLISLFISAVVCLILRDVTDRAYLAAWFGALTAIAIVRFVLVRRFHRRTPGVEETDRWERDFVASLVATASCGVSEACSSCLAIPCCTRRWCASF